MKDRDRYIKLALITTIFLSLLFIVFGFWELFKEREDNPVNLQKVIDNTDTKIKHEPLNLKQSDKGGIIILNEEVK
ncbi:MAG: hypothetical protein V2I54_14845 [Bacteroidales bacterium]|jgi:hypothetical protein|nr:hypothetical protein [Bacteroidales bacterium]